MQEIEVLKILAEIAVIFMSITVPTYAIAVSFLGREHRRILREIRKKRIELQRRLRDEDMQFDELERRFEETKSRERNLRKELRPLSVIWVVILPSLFFVLSLIAVVTAILKYPQGLVIGEFEIGYSFFGVLGALLMVIGVVIFIYVLLRIEIIVKRTRDELEEVEGSE